jgi:hypothetical protein
MRGSSLLVTGAGAALLELDGLHWSRTHDLHDDFLVLRLVIVMTERRLEDGHKRATRPDGRTAGRVTC